MEEEVDKEEEAMEERWPPVVARLVPVRNCKDSLLC